MWVTTVDFQLPVSVACDECRTPSEVRACGRIEYDWPKTTTPARTATIPTLNFARLTIDCPKCGVRVQDFLPPSTPVAKSENAAEGRQRPGLQPWRVSERTHRNPR